jgi:hypothetical protein
MPIFATIPGRQIRTRQIGVAELTPSAAHEPAACFQTTLD